MQYELTPVETRLAALCLDAACINEELEAASVKFFAALKRRGVTVEDFPPNWLAVRTISSLISFRELQELAQRLGRCPVCTNRT